MGRIAGDVHAFLYDGTLRDLNTLIAPASGWVLWQAFAVNNAGQIAGVGQFNGAQHGFLLMPVPEPTTAALASTPLAALLVRRRRR